MKGNGEDNQYCCFHPNEFLVGICAICLRERLLALASKQGHHPLPKDTRRSFRADVNRHRQPFLPKVFALGSFLHLLEFRQPRNRNDSSDDEDSIASLEDSFISIKFEDDDHASWGNKKVITVQQSTSTTIGKDGKGGKIMVEHHKRSGALRWRRRIGHLLQLGRWKRSNKASTCHVGLGGKVEEGIKGRRGWMRSLSRRRTTTTA